LRELICNLDDRGPLLDQRSLRKTEKEKLQVVTDKFEGKVKLSREKWEKAKECWGAGCECEQTKSPKIKAFFLTVLALMIAGLLY
jgi:hypothetical protein